MTDSRKEYWHDVFILYDKECDGKINISQLEKYLKAVGVIVERRELNGILDEYRNSGIEKVSF